MKTRRKTTPRTMAEKNRNNPSMEDAGDALSLLKVGHRKVEDLLERYEVATSSDEKVVLAKKVCAELVTQTTLEEEILLETWPRNEAESQHDADSRKDGGR